MSNQQDFVVVQGKTFSQVLRWESQPILYKPITAITQAAPVQLAVASHGIPPNWRVAVVSVLGMTQLNAINTPPRASDFHQATSVDPNNIALNDVNAAGFSAYASGGYVQMNTPVDLTGYSARMTIKDMISPPNFLKCTSAGTTGSTRPSGNGLDGTVAWEIAPAGAVRTITWEPNTAVLLNDVMDTHELFRLDTTNGRIVIDTVNYTITLLVSAAATALLDWTDGVYDLEMVSGAVPAVVTGLLRGAVTVCKEVTT